MLTKLKLMSQEYDFMRRSVRQLGIALIISYSSLLYFLSIYPDGCFGEFIVFALDNQYIVSVLLPLLSVILTGDKFNEVCRYPILLRYENRNKYFYIRIISKICFVGLLLVSIICALLFVGLRAGISSVSIQAYISSERFISIIVRQIFNIFGYLCLVILVHEMFRNIISSSITNILLTATLPIVNLVITKLRITKVLLWTPWGNVAYMINGVERTNYEFNWWYWLFWLMLILYLADIFNKRRDYIFEKDTKTN